MNTQPSFQHDLSGDETKVSFDLLVRTAQIACGYAKVACERDMSDLQNARLDKGYRSFAYAAEHLAEHAKDLALATDTLHILIESKSREVFTIIGKPLINT